jgi:hypothetical protein
MHLILGKMDRDWGSSILNRKREWANREVAQPEVAMQRVELATQMNNDAHTSLVTSENPLKVDS